MVSIEQPLLPAIAADGVLRCPECGAAGTHCDVAYIAARDEDEAPNEIMVNAVTGRVDDLRSRPAPAGETVGAGRRHRIAVSGTCEDAGHRFAIVFTQHKGATLVEVVSPALSTT